MTDSLISGVQGIEEKAPEEEVLDTPEDQVKEKTPIQELLEVLEGHENAPDEFQLSQWQELYGKYYASSVSGEDVYIWKTLKRLEYRGIANSGAMDKQDTLEAAVVKKCLLYPRGDSTFFSAIDAGVIPTLFKQMMYQSGFVSDEAAIAMIRRI